MGTMRSAAHTLKLPALAASLDDGCASPSSSCAPAAVPRAGAGAARPGSVQQAQQHAVPQPQCPGSPSEGYNTAGSREADSDGPSSDSSDSDQSSSCGSSPRQLGGGADRGSGSQAPRRQAPPLPPLRLPALDSADGGTAGSSSSRIPGMSLLSPQPVLGAAAAGSKSEPQGAGGGLAAALVAAAGQGPLSPEVVARLQTISSKLEAAIQSQEVELEASA